MRVDPSERGFAIARDVPERLTFTADMSDADRQREQARWEKARESIQTDYEQIRRLDWALTTLLSQLQRVRAAIEHGKIEQYRQIRQIAALAGGDKPPFELPYQVGVDDYRDVLYLLLERLDDDGKRLARIESDIVTVGLTARATDAGSGSLAANLNKVLLAVVEDASAASPRAAAFPGKADERSGYVARGKEICDAVRQTPEYVAWEKEERQKAFQGIGSFLAIVDAVTGLHASAIYTQVLDVLRGDADYLSYLKTALKLLPAGSALAKVADEAIGLTEKARKVAGQVQRAVGAVGQAVDTGKKLAAGQAGQLPALPDASGVLQVAKDGGLLNAGSDFARSRLSKQLAFFKDPKELDQVKGMMDGSSLMKAALP
jgi:hypothetical protein